MTRPWLLLAVLGMAAGGACTRQAPDCGSSCTCFTSEDCPNDNICFFGTCQNAGYNIDKVYVDLMPSTATGYLSQPDAQNPRDLSQGLDLTIRVRPSIGVSGQVNAGSASLSGLITAQMHQADPNAVVLPSLQAAQQAPLGSAMAFSLTLLPVPYDLSLQPTLSQGPSSSTVLPPLNLSAYAPSDLPLTVTYPFANLVALTGTLVAQTNTLSPVTGAQITGTAVDANGVRMVAAPATTDPNGQYTLQYLPGGNQFTITTHPGPSTTGNPLVPVMTFTVSPSGGQDVGTQALNIPAIGVGLTAQVQDISGAPVTGASVLFSGSVGSGGTPGTFTASTITNANGQASVTLLAGTYTVAVLPSSSQNLCALNVPAVCIATTGPNEGCAVLANDGGSITLTLEAQITASGTVDDYNGNPVPGARVQYSTAVGNSIRTFATNTDPNGKYSLLIDAGTAATAAAYELDVEPAQSSAVPRYRELLRVGTESFEHDVQIYAASFVYGTVLDPNGLGLSDVTIALYSADLGSAGQPLLIGLGKSTSGGEFAIPIPTAN